VNSNEIINARPATSIIHVTPEMAVRWLEANVSNRPLSRVTVEKYRRDMEAGVWHFTNAGVAWDTDGNLVDGQHRLHAIAGLEGVQGITMNVTRGLPPESRFYIDQGRKRSAGNQLAMAGVKNYNHNAAGTKLFLVWQSGILFRDNKQAQLITAPQIQEWVNCHPDLIAMANDVHAHLLKNDAQPSVTRAAFFAFAKIDPQQAGMFFEKLSSGAGLEAGNPILALRQRLETDRRTKRIRPQREQLGLLVSTWNAWRKGRTLHSVAPKAWVESNFPEPK
jgi:hypothetical protein